MTLTNIMSQGSILSLPFGPRKAGIAKDFFDSIYSSLEGLTATQLFQGYDLTPDTPDEEAFTKILEFANDISFYAPTLAFAQGMQSSMPVFMYRFNEPNTWPGPWQGRTTHIHDLTYLLLNFNQFLSGDQSQLAEDFAADVIDFINGNEPWQRWTNDQTAAKVFKVGEKGVQTDEPERTERRSLITELAGEVGFDALKGAFTRFLIGAS